MRSRTSFHVGFLPTFLLALEINLAYNRKPARCQRTTVSGVTMIGTVYSRTRRAEQLPKEPVEGAQIRLRMTTLQHSQLLPKRQVFQGELRTTTKEANQCSEPEQEQVENNLH